MIVCFPFISSTVFKQTAVSFHNFSTNKEEADADADVDANAYAEARSRFVAFLPLSSILSFLLLVSLFFLFLGRFDVGDYFEQCLFCDFLGTVRPMFGFENRVV